MTGEKVEIMRVDVVGRKWDSRKYKGILLDTGCQNHFWFFKNQEELNEMKGANEQGWEVFYSLEDFREYEDWVEAINERS